MDPTDANPDEQEGTDSASPAGAPEAVDEPAQRTTAAAVVADADDAAERHPEVIEQNPEALPDEPATATEPAKSKPKAKPKKPAGPDPAEIVRRIGRTNEQALAYVLNPDPKLSRLSRKAREALITEVPPVTAGALLGPEALARHFIASAAAGRYRDLFSLWDLFRARTEECKPVLAERQRALERARRSLSTAMKLGLKGRADRVAEDITRAQGLIWTWVREVVIGDLKAVGQRPAIAAALLQREPGLDIPLPATPDDRWLAEAAAAKQDGNLPPQLDTLLSGNIDRLPATVATLSQVQEQYPQRLEALVDRIDLESENIGALLAWARDHGMAGRVRSRIVAQVDAAAAKGRAEGLAVWQSWRDRGVDLDLPESLTAPTIEGLDLARPESADVIAVLVRAGAAVDPQRELEELAGQNRQLAEKAYESFVCAGLDVHLPMALEGNPIVRDGTRCPACQAWTWVRPGHERRCPRLKQEADAAS
ncbi:MAG: hypothetical protein GEU74_16375 [Nitriliruptorales bacterium]|nr:hypothetical protein [Nitriliruptorales bacterium]